jgi:eukaryotic-like serine/threonine-protein kinase
MGEVYRARDAKLNREVAIKVLLPAVANDPDRLAQFSREAQVLASLNHTNIAHIYGIEDADGVKALVLELVEGEDLTQRIARGPTPLDEALPIARQIADALEAAHEQGIIHRDLKPANIKVRPHRTVKALEFGLAKAVEGPGGSGSSGGLENSPTISVHATQAGIILGTAAYMSPEQARGKDVDKRADIWAFGVVVFEMLTGRRPFAGDDVSDTLVSVFRDDPDWSSLPTDTPSGVVQALRVCFTKDPKQRVRDITAVRLAMEGGSTRRKGHVPGAASAGALGAAVPGFTVSGVVLMGVIIAGAIGWLGLALSIGRRWHAAPAAALAPTPRKLLVSIGVDASLPTTFGASLILSPDGTTVAFTAQQAGQTRLFVRKLDQLQAGAAERDRERTGRRRSLARGRLRGALLLEDGDRNAAPRLVAGAAGGFVSHRHRPGGLRRQAECRNQVVAHKRAPHPRAQVLFLSAADLRVAFNDQDAAGRSIEVGRDRGVQARLASIAEPFSRWVVRRRIEQLDGLEPHA